MQRFRAAVDSVGADLRRLMDNEEIDGAARTIGMSGILGSHLMMIQDPDLHVAVEQRMHEENVNVEWAFYSVMRTYIERLQTVRDRYLRERVSDIYDISRRLLARLLAHEGESLSDINHEVILVAHDLMPIDALSIDTGVIKGIALDAGGRTTHTTILARALNLPTVIGLKHVVRSTMPGSTVVVNSNRGEVIVDPDEAVLQHYVVVRRAWKRQEQDLAGFSNKAAQTIDGVRIAITANIETSREINAALSNRIDGVGLFRSEFLFLNPRNLPDEAEQYAAYTHVLRAVGKRPVTIRTLDIGGDKLSPQLEYSEERNPLLGWRAIRYCLAHKTLFKTQLRALLRASMHGSLRIMFPMISGIEELEQALEVVDEVKAELRRANIAFRRKIPIGVMIEVPSAALTSDLLAAHADFFSIGTNDLIQYTVAVDRGNDRIAYLYNAFHPALLRLLGQIVENGHRMNIPVAMCGEMAGDPFATLILIGLGIDELSMSPVVIPEIKRTILSVSMEDVRELTQRVLQMQSGRDIDSFVRSFMEKSFGVGLY